MQSKTEIGRSIAEKTKSLGAKLMLSLITLLACTMMLELSLRLVYPKKYEYAAESYFVRDDYRIWSRSPNRSYERSHPDSGITHKVYHNNFALRQHREFSNDALRNSINVGFFGDSFTENLRVPAPYSFTEPLDYLLNTSGTAFNVLNFGVDGYGTDQSYSYYRYSKLSHHLHHVFYVFSFNDIRNIYENQLYDIDASGSLTHRAALATPWWLRLLSKLHVTYLTIDLRHRLTYSKWEAVNFLEADRTRRQARDERTNSARAVAVEMSFATLTDATLTDVNLTEAERELGNDDLDRTLAIFRALLKEWKHRVENQGGRFYIVLLPEEPPAVEPLFEGYAVINLSNLFEKNGEWQFETDGHWNETGNLRAAVHLYRFLETEVELPRLTDDAVRTKLWTYYAAFNNRWMPKVWTTPTASSEEDLTRIREKYTESEDGAPY